MLDYAAQSHPRNSVEFAVLLKIYLCVHADKVFRTKGEYYEHCEAEHPLLRHSWFITSNVYKIGKEKTQKTRSSRLLRAKLQKATVQEKENTITSEDEAVLDEDSEIKVNDDKVVDDSEMKDLEAVQDRVLVSEVKDSESALDLSQQHHPVSEIDNDRVKVDINIDTSTNISSIQIPETCVTFLSNLPPKKRFSNFSNNRRGLSDITNRLDNRCSNSNNFTKPSAVFNEKNDALQFIDLIDFDELNAIISLTHLKQSNH